MGELTNPIVSDKRTLDREAGLKIRLFGTFQVTLDGELLRTFDSDKTRALLAYLAVESDESHRREKLAGLLWPEMPEKRARASLSQALYNLRTLLGDHHAVVPFLEVSNSTIQFKKVRTTWLDSAAFTKLLEAVAHHNHPAFGSCNSCVEGLHQAVGLYRGEFLAGFYLEGVQAFQEWCSVNQERFQRQTIKALKQLAKAYEERNQISRALECAHWLVELDPYAEAPQRQLMGLLNADGQHTAALCQYESHRRTLMEELGVEPASETTTLYEHIRAAQTEPTYSQRLCVNLPEYLTVFIGREKELESLDELLQKPDIRLITIVGPGGVGKTRLAIACAQRQLAYTLNEEGCHPFPDGTCFVSLAGIDSADQITTEIAKSLNLSVPQTGMAGQLGVGHEQRLFNFLLGKRMLLILDNFEQLLEGTQAVKKLIQIAPDICILITSRQRLHLQGEQLFPIGGLTYPRLEALEDPHNYTAIQLFMNSARRLQENFELDRENLRHLAKICKILDGLPLGMELVASWAELLSLKEIETEIERNIGFLESDWLDLPERHRSLLAVCDTTWRLMRPSEQDLFARLSVFRGGFTRAAAQQVAAASTRDLQVLQRKSLLDYDQGNRRYRIHPYLRQYGYQRLSTNPEDEYQARDAHSAFFCAQIRTHNATYEAGNLATAVERVDLDYPNIQRAWDWAVEHRNLERIDQGLLGLSHYLLYNMRYSEALALCKLVNQKLADQYAGESPDTRLPEDSYLFERVHAKAINYQGYFSTFFNEDDAARLYAEGLEKLNKLEAAGYDVRLEKAQVLILISGRGPEAWYSYDPLSSKALLLESLALLEGTKRPWWTFFCLGRLGETCSEMGAHQEAKNWLEQGYVLAKKVHNQHEEVTFLVALGKANWDCADYETAKNYYRKALSKASSYHKHGWVIGILDSLGSLSLFLGSLDEAAAFFQQGIAFAEENLSIKDAIYPLTNLGVTQWLTGDFEQAKKTILMAVDFPDQISDCGVIFPNSGYIELLLITGQYREAVEKIEWFEECIEFSGWPYEAARLSRVRGWLALVEYRYTEAKQHLEAAINRLPNDNESVAWSQAGLVRARLGLNDREKARDLLIEALSSAVRIQCYIPMVFTLPMTLPILAEGDSELAIYVYRQIKSDPFLARAQLFKDLVYQDLPDEVAGLTEIKIEGGPARRKALWATAKLILEKLRVS